MPLANITAMITAACPTAALPVELLEACFRHLLADLPTGYQRDELLRYNLAPVSRTFHLAAHGLLELDRLVIRGVHHARLLAAIAKRDLSFYERVTKLTVSTMSRTNLHKGGPTREQVVEIFGTAALFVRVTEFELLPFRVMTDAGNAFAHRIDMSKFITTRIVFLPYAARIRQLNVSLIRCGIKRDNFVLRAGDARTLFSALAGLRTFYLDLVNDAVTSSGVIRPSLSQIYLACTQPIPSIELLGHLVSNADTPLRITAPCGDHMPTVYAFESSFPKFGRLDLGHVSIWGPSRPARLPNLTTLTLLSLIGAVPAPFLALFAAMPRLAHLSIGEMKTCRAPAARSVTTSERQSGEWPSASPLGQNPADAIAGRADVLDAAEQSSPVASVSPTVDDATVDKWNGPNLFLSALASKLWDDTLRTLAMGRKGWSDMQRDRLSYLCVEHNVELSWL